MGLEGLRDHLTLDRSGGPSPLQSFPPTVPAVLPDAGLAMGSQLAALELYVWLFLVSQLFYQGSSLGRMDKRVKPS